MRDKDTCGRYLPLRIEGRAETPESEEDPQAVSTMSDCLDTSSCHHSVHNKSATQHEAAAEPKKTSDEEHSDSSETAVDLESIPEERATSINRDFGTDAKPSNVENKVMRGTSPH